MYVVFTDERAPALASLALAAIGGLVLILFSHARDALESGTATPDALREGDQMLVITIVACVAMAASRFALQPALARLRRTETTIRPVARGRRSSASR